METILEKLQRCREMKRSGSMEAREKRIIDAIESERARLEKVTPLYEEAVAKGLPSKDRIIQGLIRIEKLEKELAVDHQLIDACKKALKELQEHQRAVMEYYYLDAVETWEAVAIVVGYSRRRTFQLRDEATLNLKDCTKLH